MSVCHSCNNNSAAKRSTKTVPPAGNRPSPRPSSQSSQPSTFTPITVVRPSRQIKDNRSWMR